LPYSAVCDQQCSGMSMDSSHGRKPNQVFTWF